MGPDLRRRAAAAARPRGPGPGPHLGADRAVPAAVRGGVDDGGRAVRPRPTTSTCCAGTRWTACTARWSCSRRSRCCATRPRSARCRDFTGGRFRPVIDDPRFRETTDPPPGCTASCCAAARSTTSWPRPGRSAASTTPRSSGSSSSTRCPTASWPASWSATPTPRTCAGSRRSRPTRARGRTWAWRCRRSCPGWSASGGSPGAGWPRPPPGSSKVHEVEQNALIDAAFFGVDR